MKPLHETAVLIREFEKKVLELFSLGKIQGTTHTCIGQELPEVEIISALTKDDIVISNHRSHGHYIAKTGDIKGLMAELMGLESGINKGVGGSQHLCNHEFNFYSNGVQGNMIPVAAGMAWVEKIKNTGNVIVCFIGDGTLGQGVFYETLNIARIEALPLLIVVEDNGIAQSTKRKGTVYGKLPRACSSAKYYPTHIKSHVEFIRRTNTPLVLYVFTRRIAAHSKGDDNRSQDELIWLKANDWYNDIPKWQKQEAREEVEYVLQQILK